VSYCPGGGQDRAMRLFRAEYANLKPMFEQGFVPRNRMFELDAPWPCCPVSAARIFPTSAERKKPDRGKSRAHLAHARKTIARKSIPNSPKHRKTGRRLKERRIATLDDLARVTWKAPVSGVVVGLAAHTVGGVIAPGEKINGHPPDGEVLQVELQIPTISSTMVHAGLTAQLHFLALNQTVTPTVEGRLSYVFRGPRD